MMKTFSYPLLIVLMAFFSGCSVEDVEPPNGPPIGAFASKEQSVNNKLEWNYSHSRKGGELQNLSLSTRSYPVESNGERLEFITAQDGANSGEDYLNFAWLHGRVSSGITYDLMAESFFLEVQRNGSTETVSSSDGRLRKATIRFSTYDGSNEEIAGHLVIEYSDNGYISHELDFDITTAPEGQRVFN